MLVPMRRVDIVAPRSSASLALRAIHRAGILHLTGFEPVPGSSPTTFWVESAGPVDEWTTGSTPYDGAAQRVAELAGLLLLPEAPPPLVASLWELDDADLLDRVASLEPVGRRASELAEERVRRQGDVTRLAGYRRLVEGLRGAVGHLPAIRGYGSTGIVVHARYRAVIALVREELETVTAGRCEVIAVDFGTDRVAAVLLYPIRLAAEVRSLLGGRDLEEVTLPESLVGVPFDELGPRLAAEEAAARARRASAEDQLAAFAVEYGPTVAALQLVLWDRIAEAHALAAAGRSDHLVVVGGWLPAAHIDSLRSRLAADVGSDVLVIERPDDPTAREAPVLLQNRGAVRAFEPLASFVSLPRYGTLDPTPAVALAFPVFVGLMVGDAAYGLILLALLLLARHRWGSSRAMTVIWPVGVLAAISTIFFGILFGEWLGPTGHLLTGIEPLWFDRADGALPLLVLAIAIGFGQIVLGLVLGIANATALRERREAIGRAALLASLVAIAVAVGYAAGYVPEAAGQIALAVLIVAVLVLAATLGLAGPLEVMGAVGNVLSYARLMAIGLASVMLALVANRLGGLFENVLLGIAIAVLFHALNFTLGYFDASVQGLRLQYVEFFSKFVEPGGIRYEPFVSVLRDPDRGLGLRSTGGA